MKDPRLKKLFHAAYLNKVSQGIQDCKSEDELLKVLDQLTEDHYMLMKQKIMKEQIFDKRKIKQGQIIVEDFIDDWREGICKKSGIVDPDQEKKFKHFAEFSMQKEFLVEVRSLYKKEKQIDQELERKYIV